MVLYSLKFEICKVNFTDNIYNRRKPNCEIDSFVLKALVPRIGQLLKPAKLYKRKHPKKRKKKKQGARTKVHASKQPKQGGPQG